MAIVALIVSGCGSGGVSSPCAAAQSLAISGYSTGPTALTDGLAIESSPFPTNATYLYFKTSNVATYGSDEPVTVSGSPILTGSGGSRITGGTLVPVEAFADVSLSLFGYSSSIAGLKANLGYTVSFAALTASPGGCRYGAQNAGSFTTE